MTPVVIVVIYFYTFLSLTMSVHHICSCEG